MNKYLPISILLLSFVLFFSGATCIAQKLDFSASIDTSKAFLSHKMTITVHIQGGTPDYKVFCLDKIINQGGKIVATAQKINESTYQFPKITLSNFQICVLDNKQSLLCKPEKLLKATN